MAGEVAKIARPMMKGHCIKFVQYNIFSSMVFGTVMAAGYWYFIARQRKINYANFYKTYDADKEYERMKAAGVFKSV